MVVVVVDDARWELMLTRKGVDDDDERRVFDDVFNNILSLPLSFLFN